MINKFIYIIIFSFAFSNAYQFVSNNELDFSENYAFEDFLSELKSKGVGKFEQLWSGGVQSNDFSFIPYLDRIEFNRKEPSAAYFTTLDGNIELKVTEQNFNEFRENFILYKSLLFEETEFPAKVFKVKTQGNIEEIEFLETPHPANGQVIEKAAGDLVYYVFGKKTVDFNGDLYTYYLINKNKKTMPKNDDKQGFLCCVLAKKNDDVGQVVLWNTSLGIRPKNQEDLELKPIVFLPSTMGELAHTDYVDGSDLDEDQLMINADGLAKYHEDFESKRGVVHRWLPNYIFDGNDNGIKIGYLADYNDLIQDILQQVGGDVINLVVVIDASMSMDFVWNSMRPVLDMTLKNLGSAGIKNPLGEIVKPRFKVWAYHLNTQKVTTDWVDEETNYDYESELKNACCTSSQAVRPALSETLTAAFKDVSADPAYILVMGDASDFRYPGQFLMENQEIIEASGSNYFKALRGIRIYSTIIDIAKNSPNDPEAADYVRSYEEFANHFNNGTKNDLLFDVKEGALSQMSMDQIQSVSDQITNVITSDLEFIYEEIKASISGNKTDPESKKAKNLSAASEPFLEQLRANRADWKKGTGTFYNEGIIVSNLDDVDKTSLLETDIVVAKDNLLELQEFLQEYVINQTEDEVQTLIRGMLSIFFEVEMHLIDNQFLSETTMNELWSKIVGNKDVADKLVPGLFRESDYSFAELLERLPEYEETFLTNCQNISDNLNEQIQSDQSLFVGSANLSTGQVNEYYWVNSSDLQLFKGVKLD